MGVISSRGRGYSRINIIQCKKQKDSNILNTNTHTILMPLVVPHLVGGGHMTNPLYIHPTPTKWPNTPLNPLPYPIKRDGPAQTTNQKPAFV